MPLVNDDVLSSCVPPGEVPELNGEKGGATNKDREAYRVVVRYP